MLRNIPETSGNSLKLSDDPQTRPTRPDRKQPFRPPLDVEPGPDHLAFTPPFSLWPPPSLIHTGKPRSECPVSRKSNPATDDVSGHLRPIHRSYFAPLLPIYPSMVVDHQTTAYRDRMKLGNFGPFNVSTPITTPSGKNLTLR